MREYRGTFTEPGRDSPWRERARRTRTSTSSRRMRAGEFPNGARTLRAQHRHGLAEHRDARPGALPHPARRTPPHRRQVVHLPDVRLRALPVGRDRGHHALDLHAGVRCPTAPLYDWVLDQLDGSAPSAPAADRVRAAEPDLHGDEQAHAARPRRGRPRARLGRSAHADHLRHAPPRLHAGRRSARSATASASPRPTTWWTFAQLEHHVRDDLNKTLRARDGRARSAAGRHRELAGGPGRDAGSRQQPRGRRRRHAPGAVLAASSTSSATTSWKTRRRSSSGSRPAARCGCATRTSSPARASSRTPTATITELRCTYDPATPRRQRARRPQGEGDAALGVGGARHRRRGPPVQPAVHAREPDEGGRRARRRSTA